MTHPAFSGCSATARDLGIDISYAMQDQPDGLAQAFVIGADHIGTDTVALALGDNIFYGPGSGHQPEPVPRRRRRSDLRLLGGRPVGVRCRRVRRRRHGAVAGGEAGQPEIALRGAGLYFYDNDVIEIARGVEAVGARRVRDHRGQPDLPGPGPAGRRGACPRHRLAGHRNLRLPAGRQRFRPHHRTPPGSEDLDSRRGRLADGLHRRRAAGQRRAHALLKSGYGGYLLELLDAGVASSARRSRSSTAPTAPARYRRPPSGRSRWPRSHWSARRPATGWPR